MDANQLSFMDDGTLVEVPMDHIEELDLVKTDYENLSKVDLIRLCKEKDIAVESYEHERKTTQERFEKEISNMNDYYNKRFTELKNMITYYDRKFKLIADIIFMDKFKKEETNNDTI